MLAAIHRCGVAIIEQQYNQVVIKSSFVNREVITLPQINVRRYITTVRVLRFAACKLLITRNYRFGSGGFFLKTRYGNISIRPTV